MLTGMLALRREEPLPDDIFYAIFEINDRVEQQKYIEALRNAARKLKRITEFNNLFKEYQMDYLQRMKQKGNKTAFTDQPLELNCGEWTATDFGIRMNRYDRSFQPVVLHACSHPVMPVEILKNVDTSEERITLAYYKSATWQRITVGRSVCANTNKIVDALSQYGIEVTSDNAKELVRYISDCVGYNPVILNPKRSISHLGWFGFEFMPYAENIVYDGDEGYRSLYDSVGSRGNYQVWRDHCRELRKNPIVRLAFAASAGSVLIEPLNILPFIFHLWAVDSGTGKTVAIMAAMSLWGDPSMGKLTRTLDGTRVGIIRNAAFLHSLPFAGDELQTVKENNKKNFDQLIYRLTEGVDRIRGKASGGVEDTKTWHSSFLFTGEEPITKQNSREGSKNRVIEIAVENKLLEDGNHTVFLLSQNHGFGGRRIVEYLQETGVEKIREEYREYFEEICRLDTTEKQAMAMACMLVADKILTELIFTDEDPLSVAKVQQHLRSAREVDVAERSYQMVLNWIARNPVRFQDPREKDSANRGEVWGKIIETEGQPEKPPTAVINKDVLCSFLDEAGFDYAAVTKKWVQKDFLVRNSQGKYVHNTKVYGIKANYIKIRMQPIADSDGFLEMEEYEQMTLPFD